MILVILVLSLLTATGGGYLLGLRRKYQSLGTVLSVTGSIIAIISFVAAGCLTADISIRSALQKEIAMYQEENQKIEARLKETVELYQQYETNVFENVSDNNLVATISFFPELKSDTLVQKEIETYVRNNSEVKRLKSRLLYTDVERWWLFFGQPLE